jgi:hypothetical protein
MQIFIIIADFARCQASARYIVKGKKVTNCQLTLGFQNLGFLFLKIDVLKWCCNVSIRALHDAAKIKNMYVKHSIRLFLEFVIFHLMYKNLVL